MVSKDIALETKNQGVNLTKVHENIVETKDNVEAGNEELTIKISRDTQNNKCLIGCLATTFALVVIIIVFGF